MSSLPVSKTGILPSPSSASAPSTPSKESLGAASAARALLIRKLEEIVVLTRESTNADGVAIALRENGRFFCRASVGFAPEPGIVVEPGQGVCGRCIIDARVLVCQDLAGDIKSTVAAPIIVGDEIEGLLAAFSFQTGAFSSEHIDLVSRIAVDVGNQVASPETIHLVPRGPVSILDDPRADVVAVDDLSLSSREKHLEVLEAVTAPAFPAAKVDPSTENDNSRPETIPFRFLGYDESAPAEPEVAPTQSELLGEYLSKWDIVVIFGAILIAMLALSFWLNHKRASQPYVAPYTPQHVETQATPQNAQTIPNGSEALKKNPSHAKVR